MIISDWLTFDLSEFQPISKLTMSFSTYLSSFFNYLVNMVVLIDDMMGNECPQFKTRSL